MHQVWIRTILSDKTLKYKDILTKESSSVLRIKKTDADPENPKNGRPRARKNLMHPKPGHPGASRDLLGHRSGNLPFSGHRSGALGFSELLGRPGAEKTTKLDRKMPQSGNRHPGLFRSSQATVLELWTSPDLLGPPGTQLGTSWTKKTIPANPVRRKGF